MVSSFASAASGCESITPRHQRTTLSDKQRRQAPPQALFVKGAQLLVRASAYENEHWENMGRGHDCAGQCVCYLKHGPVRLCAGCSKHGLVLAMTVQARGQRVEASEA